MRSIACLFVALVLGASGGEVRTWTDREGRSFEGERVFHNEETVTIRRVSDDKEFSVPRSKLSRGDDAYLASIDRLQVERRETPKGRQPSLAGSLWAGKWNNEVEALLVFSSDPGKHKIVLDHTWRDEAGNLQEESIKRGFGHMSGDSHQFLDVEFFRYEGQALVYIDHKDGRGVWIGRFRILEQKNVGLDEVNFDEIGWRPLELEGQLPPRVFGRNISHATVMKLQEQGRNRIENGGFEDGLKGWEGDAKTGGDWQDIRVNYAVLRAGAEKDVQLSQSFELSGMKKVELWFDVAPSFDFDYEEEEYEIQLIRESGKVEKWNWKPPGYRWQSKRITFTLAGKSEQLEIRFILKAGTPGCLGFDGVRIGFD